MIIITDVYILYNEHSYYSIYQKLKSVVCVCVCCDHYRVVACITKVVEWMLVPGKYANFPKLIAMLIHDS